MNAVKPWHVYTALALLSHIAGAWPLTALFSGVAVLHFLQS